MAEYTRCKTVRFEPETWKKIEIDAANGSVTTSEYIRSIICEAVADIVVEA